MDFNNHVSVDCVFSYQHIEELEYSEAVGNHSHVSLKLAISDRTRVEISDCTICDSNLEIKMWENGRSKVIFSGYINYASWDCTNSLFLEIKALSYSKKLDKVKKRKSYQETGIKYEKIFESILAQYDGDYLMYGCKERLIEVPIVQYEETDWEFIKRLGAKLQAVVVVNSETKMPRVYIGRINNISLVVLRKKTILKNGMIEYHYLFSENSESIYEQNNKSFLAGKAIKGTVFRIEGERVGLSLETDYNKKVKSNYTYLYLPVTGNFLYAMPEIGARVELYFPTEDVKDAFVRRCFWKDESCHHFQYKFLKTSDKSLEFQPDSILYESAENGNPSQSMQLNDRTGITIVSSKKMLLQSKQKVSLYSKGSCKLEVKTNARIEQLNTDNCIEMSSNGITISGESYEVSSADIKTESSVSALCVYNIALVNQYALAALPVPVSSHLNTQVLASIPQTISLNTFNRVGTGYFR